MSADIARWRFAGFLILRDFGNYASDFIRERLSQLRNLIDALLIFRKQAGDRFLLLRNRSYFLIA